MVLATAEGMERTPSCTAWHALCSIWNKGGGQHPHCSLGSLPQCPCECGAVSMQRALPLLSCSEGAAGPDGTSVTKVWHKSCLCQHIAPNFGVSVQRQVASCWRRASPAVAPQQDSCPRALWPDWVLPIVLEQPLVAVDLSKSWLWGVPVTPDWRKVSEVDMAQQQPKEVEAIKIGLKPKFR